MGDVGMLIESAIGGESISSTIEGRKRYPINLRYARELRDDPEKLKRVLVPVMDGAQVPLGQLADIQLTAGPSMIKNEEGQLVGYVTVDMAGRDIGGYVEEAKRVVAQKITLPLGYTLSWSGQYEYMQRAKERLIYVIPLTILIIFVLLYLNFQSVAKTLIVLLSVSFRPLCVDREHLAALFSGLQSKRCRLGRDHRTCWSGSGDRRRDDRLPR